MDARRHSAARRFILLLPALCALSLQAGFSGTDVFIPAVARASGAGGSQFYSTLWISNLSDATASFQIQLLRQGQPNPEPLVRSETLAAGATRRYDDIVQLFGVTGLGAALHILSDRELFVSSRTYDQQPGTQLKDAKGLFFSGIPAGFAIASGETARLQGVSNGPQESYRYNFGLVETTGQPATVVVTLKDEAGNITNTQQYLLGGLEARQVNAFSGFAPPVSTTNAILEAFVESGTGKVLFYGTQIAGTGENPGSNDSAGFEMSFKSSLLGASGGSALTGVFAGAGLTGGGNTGNVTLSVGTGAIVGSMLANGHVVRSLNSLKDNVTLQAGSNVTITPSGSTLTIAAASGGLTLPYSGTINLGTPAFSVTNGNVALYGKSTGSRGVWGEGGAFGVYGQGNEGVHGSGGPTGVYGTGTSQGIYGKADGGDGVRGEGNTGVRGVGGTVGVLGTGSVYGIRSIGDLSATGVKMFVEPHPTDPDKEIRFVALEGPESGTYFRGSARTSNGVATIEVPESFRLVTDEKNLTVVVTPMGELAVLACVRKSLDEIVIRSSQDVDFDYVVHGVRKAFTGHEAISKNVDFVPSSPTDTEFTRYLPAESVRRLKANGVLDEDGSIRTDTAERLGWARIWAERAVRPD